MRPKVTNTDRGMAALLAITTLCCTLTGCRKQHSDEVAVRLIDAAPDVDNLRVSVAGHLWKEMRYASTSGYQKAPKGDFRVELEGIEVQSAEGEPIYFSLRKYHRYTLVALSPSSSRSTVHRARLFDDTTGEPIPLGTAHLTFMNAGAGTGPVDLVVNHIVGIAGIKFGMRSSAVPLAAGDYQISVTLAGAVQPLVAPQDVHLNEKTDYMVVLMGKPDIRDRRLEVFDDK